MRVSLGSPSWHGGRCLGVRPLLTGVCVWGGVLLKLRPPPPTLVSFEPLVRAQRDLDRAGLFLGPALRGVTGRGTRAARGASCQGLGPGHWAGRACRPLALGSWSCPGLAGSVKVDRADRLAFRPQLWGVMGDGGSVLAFCLRPASGPGWSAEVLPAATHLWRGPAQPRAPAPAPRAGAAPSPWFLVLVFGSCLVRPFPSLGLPSP